MERVLATIKDGDKAIGKNVEVTIHTVVTNTIENWRGSFLPPPNVVISGRYTIVANDGRTGKIIINTTGSMTRFDGDGLFR